MQRPVALLTLVLLLVSLPTFASSSNSFAFSGSANSVAATQQISQGSGGRSRIPATLGMPEIRLEPVSLGSCALLP